MATPLDQTVGGWLPFAPLATPVPRQITICMISGMIACYLNLDYFIAHSQVVIVTVAGAPSFPLLCEVTVMV